MYLGSSMSAGSGLSDEINLRIMKFRLTGPFLALACHVTVKSTFYNAPIRAVFLYACETPSPNCLAPVFGNHCLRRNAGIQCQRYVSNSETRYCIFRPDDGN